MYKKEATKSCLKPRSGHFFKICLPYFRIFRNASIISSLSEFQMYFDEKIWLAFKWYLIFLIFSLLILVLACRYRGLEWHRNAKDVPLGENRKRVDVMEEIEAQESQMEIQIEVEVENNSNENSAQSEIPKK
ncbi:hypothetical protein BpHYR1_003518 [Brachionus plicatilis]|uniref:Uncharacterized protein n=1 Tax=Brachionus plicatilis TaxID=10195 RepID=A0A3M7RV16_BRAPC|nr:hypothetical protein BpHYR1_003518 [Brachionus plicatilis]